MPPSPAAARRKKLIFGSITTGASNDIEQATKLARAMITRYGMSDDFDMVAMETVTNQYLGGDTSLSLLRRRHRPDIDAEGGRARQGAACKSAVRSSPDNRQKLDELAQYLYEKETITGDEFMEILERKELPEAEPQA